MTVLSNPQQLRKDVNAKFIETLLAPRDPMLVQRIADVVNSNSDREDYAWLGEVAAMNEWVDSLEESDLSETADAGYGLENKKYTGALRIERDDLADEKTMGLAQRTRDLATRALYKADELLINAVIDGTTNTGYDGVAFFSASHTARGQQSSTQSNLITGAGVSTANVASDLNKAIAALYNFVDEANEPLNAIFKKLFILYPPILHKPVKEAISAGIISNTSNVQFADESFDFIRESRLTTDSTVDYYVGIADAEAKPLIWQDREGISLEQSGPGSDTWVQQEQVVYKARMRGRAGYARWQRMIKINNT
jgi:phage major head subunit gpT-like protein